MEASTSITVVCNRSKSRVAVRQALWEKHLEALRKTAVGGDRVQSSLAGGSRTRTSFPIEHASEPFDLCCLFSKTRGVFVSPERKFGCFFLTQVLAVCCGCCSVALSPIKDDLQQ